MNPDPTGVASQDVAALSRLTLAEIQARLARLAFPDDGDVLLCERCGVEVVDLEQWPSAAEPICRACELEDDDRSETTISGPIVALPTTTKKGPRK